MLVSAIRSVLYGNSHSKFYTKEKRKDKTKEMKIYKRYICILVKSSQNQCRKKISQNTVKNAKFHASIANNFTIYIRLIGIQCICFSPSFFVVVRWHFHYFVKNVNGSNQRTDNDGILSFFFIFVSSVIRFGWQNAIRTPNVWRKCEQLQILHTFSFLRWNWMIIRDANQICIVKPGYQTNIYSLRNCDVKHKMKLRSISYIR